MNVDDRLLSIPEARSRLGHISKGLAYKLIQDGKLQRVHVGRRALVTESSVAAYIDALAKDASS